MLGSAALYALLAVLIVLLGRATKQVIEEKKIDLTFVQKVVKPEPPPPPPPKLEPAPEPPKPKPIEKKPDLPRPATAKPPAAAAVVVPNPGAAQRTALAAAVPGLRLLAGSALDGTRRLAGRASVRLCWLDYCDALGPAHRADLRALFACDVLDPAGAVVAATFSWRGAAGSRAGPPKDGPAYLADVADALAAEVVAAAAAAPGPVERWSLRPLLPPVQCGQLFFLVFFAARQ